MFRRLSLPFCAVSLTNLCCVSFYDILLSAIYKNTYYARFTFTTAPIIPNFHYTNIVVQHVGNILPTILPLTYMLGCGTVVQQRPIGTTVLIMWWLTQLMEQTTVPSLSRTIFQIPATPCEGNLVVCQCHAVLDPSLSSYTLHIFEVATHPDRMTHLLLLDRA